MSLEEVSSWKHFHWQWTDWNLEMDKDCRWNHKFINTAARVTVGKQVKSQAQILAKQGKPPCFCKGWQTGRHDRRC